MITCGIGGEPGGVAEVWIDGGGMPEAEARKCGSGLLPPASTFQPLNNQRNKTC